MKRKSLFIFSATIIMVFLGTSALAGAHGHKAPRKVGILLVAFGSSLPSAQVSFENIDKTVKATFKGMPVRWAYTSAIIRNKLAKQGEVLDSVAMALAKMTDEGFTHVAVQSLHTIRGEEYDDLARTARAFEGMPNGIEHIVIGTPLISSQAPPLSRSLSGMRKLANS